MSETERILAINKKIQDVKNREQCKFIFFEFSEDFTSSGEIIVNVEMQPIQAGKVSVVVLNTVNAESAELTCDLLIDGEVAVENVFFDPIDLLSEDLPTYKTNLYSGGTTLGIIPIECILRFKIENVGEITEGVILIILDFNKLNLDDRITDYEN